MVVILEEIMLAGLVLKSKAPAATRPQLAAGPQKCTVFGPTGELRKLRIWFIKLRKVIIIFKKSFAYNLFYWPPSDVTLNFIYHQ